MIRKTTITTFAALAASVAGLCAPTVASAIPLPFGQTLDFESLNVGDHPSQFLDSNTATGYGSVVVGGDGSNHYAVLTTAGDDSRAPGEREAPYGRIGTQQAYPTTADSYSIFTDIYTEAATGVSGSFKWINAANNKNNGQHLTESGFTITPGEFTWHFTTNASSNSQTNVSGTKDIDLNVDTWYTMELWFHRSAQDVSFTNDIYAQGTRGAGSPLYTYSYTFTDSYVQGGALSSLLGGPRYSWFTRWDNDTVDSIRIDNIGTAAAVTVAEPPTLALLGLGGGLMLMMMGWRRRNVR